MLKLRKPIAPRPGQALLEYMTLIVFILGAFLVMQKYIARGFAGRWKGIGDSLGQERLYDPDTTTSCAFDYQYYNIWYSVRAFEDNGCARSCYFDKELLDDDTREDLEEACRICICASQSQACGGRYTCD